MSADNLSRVRKSILPTEGDTWNIVAKRELPDLALDEALAKLQSWNLHVFMRAAGAMAAPGGGNPILPSDVVFVEPPLAT
tara:strand:+ start:4063 stop:4302 length:240 start_codon:yes stop_codon:yes gene_type:complete